MFILDLIYNLAVLVALSVFSGFIDQRFDRKEFSGKILQGLLFGISVIVGMLYPFVLAEGIIFDGRSIVISLCTLFFGPISGAISAIIAIGFRINLGGGGALMGVLVISTSFLIGLIFYLNRIKKFDKAITNLQLYIFGILVHAAMLFYMLTLPQKNIIEAYKVLTITIIGVYPIVTVLIGKILLDQEQNQDFVKQIKRSEEKYRLLVENQTDLIVKTDTEGKFLFANQPYCQLFGVKEDDLIGKSFRPLVHEDDLPVVEKALTLLFKPPYYCIYDERANTKFGWRWIEWEAKAVLDRKGKVVELIGAGRDITKRKLAEISLNKRLEFEKTLASVSARFISVEAENIDKEINESLSKIGEVVSADRIYLFLMSEDERYFNNTHEWCNEGIEPQINNLQNVPAESIPWWVEKLKKFELIHIPKVSQLPFEARTEREILEAQDIKSVIVIPLVIGSKFKGFLGFDSVLEEKMWADEDIILLKVLGEIFSNALSRMKSKELLRDLLARQSAILLAMPDMIFNVDKDGYIRGYNAPNPAMLPKPPEEFLNKHIANTFSKELAGKFITLIEKALTENEVQQYEYSDINDATVKHFEVRIAPGGGDQTVFIIRDISEKKQAEQTLVKLNRAIEQSSIGVIITNRTGDIEYVNPFFTTLTGYTLDEVKGRNPRILKSGHHSREFYGKLWDKISAGKNWQGEILNRRKNGENFWGNVLISPILNKEGEITNFVGIQEDVTEQKKMLAELVEAKEKAEEMNRLKSIFFANMSHELRTPMIGIMGNAELLEAETADEQHKKMLKTIYKSATRLNETLNSILDITKIEIEGVQKQLKSLDVNTLVEETLELYAAAAKDKGNTIIFEKTEDSLIIVSDDQLLTKILYNLMSNAIKYTINGLITIRTKYKNGNAFIEVEDTGIGIAEKDINLIFEPFRQTSEGYSRKYEGTGLGLTITKRFAEILGGNIRVKSILGKGSTFTVEIPDNKQDRTEIQSINKPVINNSSEVEIDKRVRILIVEDEAINAEVLLRILRDKYDAYWVQSGEEAIDKVKEYKFDLILMDIGLSGKINGLGAVGEIRRMKEYRQIPIIAVTAYSMEGDREKFLENGCNYYLSKPFRSIELIDIIKKALNN